MLTWEFPPHVVGGLGIACAGLARALEPHLDLRVLTPGASGGDAYAPLYGGDPAARIRAFAEAVSDQARESGRFDLIHAHDWMSFPTAVRLARESGAPLIAHVHSLEADRGGGGEGDPRIREIEAAGLRAATRVIAVSRKTAADAAREYGLDPAKIEVVWNGVEPVRPWRVATPKKRVVFLGRMTAQKAPERFVRMAARVAATRPDARFTMAGRGELLAAVRRLAAELGLEKTIDFPGFLDRASLRALLARSAVCAMTSRSEPFGLVALEAAQFAVPCVLTPGTGAAEVLASARVARGDRAFAAEVGRLLDDDEVRARLGYRAMGEAALLTWERAAGEVLRIYRDCG